jgi:hypothetical protein
MKDRKVHSPEQALAEEYKKVLADIRANPPQMAVGTALPMTFGPSKPLVSSDFIDQFRQMASPRGRILMRLNLEPMMQAPFDLLEAHQKPNGTYVVFVVKGDQHTVLEDDGLFPSDQLILSLKTLIG